MKKFIAGVIGLLVLAAAPVGAQEPPAEPPPEEQPSDEPAGEPGEKPPADEEGEPKEGKDAADAAQDAVEDATEAATPEVVPVEEAPVKPVEPVVPEVDPERPFGTPNPEDVDREFVPLEEIEEGGLQQIIPAKVYPRVEWNGTFRTRVKAAVNWDLDTEGTSAVLPPAESFTPAGDPINPERDTHWDANMRLKLDPTIFITELLRVRTEVDLLDNVVFGSLPANRLGVGLVPDLSRRTGISNSLSPREREWFDDAISVNELYGEVDTIFGKLSAGRMDDDWGLGIFVNDGDCLDCDYGVHVDRFRLETKVWELYGAASVDFPDEGVTSKSPFNQDGLPYDIAQIDDVDQYSFQVFRTAKTREEKELQGKRLLDDKLPVLNGGGFYRFRRQQGRFVPLYTGEAFDATVPGDLIFRGERLHIADLWGEFLYQPNFDTSIRIELEGIAAFGRVDNASELPVGAARPGEEAPNCFDGDEFSANETACTTNSDGEATSRGIQQFGLALESEFKLDSPVSFGFNGGFASGGSSPNWGTSGSEDLSFYRFSHDYDVDLILFREVIGTVTNAYYFNPYAMVTFLESSAQHIELQLDGIGSRAFDTGGTPSGLSPWLGLEFDAAVRYVSLDVFTAALEAGILFPFEGLAGATGRPRYQQFGANAEDYNAEFPARIAWTIQTKLFWNF